MAISSIGVGSGLPLDELLTDLRKSENAALTAIQSRQVQAETRLSAYGTLKSALTALNSAAAALGKADNYAALSTRVSGDAFTAKASPQAIAGQYSVQVHSLASSQTLVSQGQADRNASIGAGGRLTFTFAGADGSGAPRTHTLDLGSGGASLVDIVQAINSDSTLGVRATLVNDGDANAPHRLLLTTTDTGTDAAITRIEVDGNSALSDVLAFDHGDPSHNMSEKQAASNAALTINNIDVSSQSNTIENAIEGLTLTLENVSPQASTLTVTQDDSVAAQAIKKFISAYNEVQSTIRSLTAFDVEANTQSALTGDSLARRLQSEVRNAINVVAPEGELRVLAQLGVRTNVSTGMLEIDDAKLTQALKDNMADVRALMTGTNGLSARIDRVTETFNRTAGLFDTATDGLTRSISDLTRQYEVTAERIDNKMEAYRRQFSALDAMVAQMNSVSTYLSQQLSMLGNIGKEK